MFDDKITKLRKEQFVEAESVAYLVKDEQKRKLAFLNTCALFAFKNYIEKNKYAQAPVTNANLFRVPVAVEKYEIFDLYLGNIRLDVRVSMDGKYFPIPKCHIKKSIAADFYVVYKRTKNPLKCEAVGFIKKEDLIFDSQDDNYYYISNSILNPIKELKQEVVMYVKEQKIFFSTEHRLATENFVAFLDGDLDEIKSLDLIEHLLACSECRSKFVEYSFLEDVLTAVKYYPELKQETELVLNINNEKAEENKPVESIEEEIGAETADGSSEEIEESAQEDLVNQTNEESSEIQKSEIINNDADAAIPIVAAVPVQPPIESIVSAIEQSPIAEFMNEKENSSVEERTESDEPSAIAQTSSEEEYSESPASVNGDNFEINETEEKQELTEIEENEKAESTTIEESVNEVVENEENSQNNENEVSQEETVTQNSTQENQDANDSDSQQETENDTELKERHIPPVEFEEYTGAESEENTESVVDLSNANLKDDNATWVAQDDKYNIVENEAPKEPDSAGEEITPAEELKSPEETYSVSEETSNNQAQDQTAKTVEENQTSQEDNYGKPKVELNPVITFDRPKESYEEEKMLLYTSEQAEEKVSENVISDMEIEPSVFESEGMNADNSLDINISDENINLDLIEGQPQSEKTEVILDVPTQDAQGEQSSINYEPIQTEEQNTSEESSHSGLVTPFDNQPSFVSEQVENQQTSSWSSLYNVNSNSDNSDSMSIIGSPTTNNIEPPQSYAAATEMFNRAESNNLYEAQNPQVQSFPEGDMPMRDSELSTLYDKQASPRSKEVNENHFVSEIETNFNRPKKVADASVILVSVLLLVSVAVGGILFISKPASEGDSETATVPSEYESQNGETSENMDKVMTEAFSDGQQTVKVSKMQWQKDVESTPELKEYMNDVASSVWDDLDVSLGAVQGYVASAPSKIVISITNKGEIQDVRIGKSCGSKEIDDVILQSVKKVASTMPPSTYSISGKKMNLILVVNF